MNHVSPTLRPGTSPATSVMPGVTTGGDAMPIIRQYLRIALRWRYVILGAVAACFTLGLIVTLLMTPQYTATSTIEISRETGQLTNFQGAERQTGVADQEFYQTQYGLLESRVLAERVATQLRLVDDKAFFERFGVNQDDIAFREANGRYGAAGRPARQRIAGKILLNNINFAPTRLSRLVEINFTSPDPGFSARVANAWAENFIQTNLERKVQATSYGRNLLQRELAQAKERLDESQRQLVTYAEQQRIINLPAQGSGENTTAERSIVADELAALNTALSQATAERIAAEARFREAGRGGQSSEALRNQAINTLRQRRAELAAANRHSTPVHKILSMLTGRDPEA